MENPWMRLTVLVTAGIAGYLLVRLAVLPLVQRAVRRTQTRWDDIIADRSVRHRLGWLAPLIILKLGLTPALDATEMEQWLDLAERLAAAALLVAGILVMGAVVEVANRIYSETEISKERPIKSYLQVAMIMAWILGIILAIGLLTDQSIGVFLGGVGAFSAVVILVFKDTILSIVASVQLTGNDMLRVGDWIEMPSQGADGDVIEIALHTIKVQNWDKTITTVPTYKLISDSFKNWRGMTDAGARRIKRSLLIDTTTVRFLTAEELERWARFAPLKDHIDRKRDELAAWNARHDPGPELVGDPRRLTNLGTFRAYVEAYLERNPNLATDTMTKLVRQLQPTPHGVPLEIYVFSSTTNWAEYEAIQADIFDHLLAIAPEFGLKIHEAPTGASIASLRSE